MLRLYGNPRSRAMRCLWMLEEMGEPYQLIEKGTRTDELQSADYVRLNPNARIPTLVDGGQGTSEPPVQVSPFKSIVGELCPLRLQKRTLLSIVRMSAQCQIRKWDEPIQTFADVLMLQSKRPLFFCRQRRWFDVPRISFSSLFSSREVT
jgi:hypothetical protein